MKTIAAGIAMGVLLTGALAMGQSAEDMGQGEAVVTVLPKHEGEVPPSVANQDLSVKVNGKNGKVTKWSLIQSPADTLELVLLIDDSARTSLGTQLEEMAHFIKTLPPNTKVSVGYMQNGRAVLTGPLTTDHDRAAGTLHLPGGSPGYDASPYFCLSDLAQHWPSNDPAARREVVMVTDGVDYYEKRYDPEDPYVDAAIKDSVRARLIVYSIYWINRGRLDATGYENNAGQNLLTQLTEATGGKNFWIGLGDPVSFQPYFDELTRRFRNQYELGFTSPGVKKPEVETLKLKLSAPGTEVDAPQQVLVVPEGGR